MAICYIEGKFVPLEDACLPVTDFIIQRGVGVFESLRTYDKKLMQFTRHLKRLKHSAASAEILMPMKDSELLEIIRRGVNHFDGDVLVRIYITGGDIFDKDGRFSAGRLFAIFDHIHKPPREIYERGASLYIIEAERILPTTKSINYMAYFATQASDRDALEALYCPDGEITEGSSSSFFLIQNGRIITAPTDRVLDGTTRSILMQIARREGITVEERCPMVAELATAEEAFITGSLKEIVPIVKVGDVVIGGGQPGPLTKHLHRLYLDNIVNWLE